MTCDDDPHMGLLRSELAGDRPDPVHDAAYCGCGVREAPASALRAARRLEREARVLEEQAQALLEQARKARALALQVARHGDSECEACEGSGWVEAGWDYDRGHEVQEPCAACDSTGYALGAVPACPDCDAEGEGVARG